MAEINTGGDINDFFFGYGLSEKEVDELCINVGHFHCTKVHAHEGELAVNCAWTKRKLKEWIEEAYDDEWHTSNWLINGDYPFQMAITKEERHVLIPGSDKEWWAEFGSETERELEALMVTRAAESDEKRVQLDEFRGLLKFKPNDDLTVLSKIRGLNIHGV